MSGKSTDVDVARVAAELLEWARGANAPGLADLVSALGRLGDQTLTTELATLAEHDDAEVRLVVAQALGELEQMTPPAVEALIALSNDPVDEIRSWATFALAQPRIAHEPGVCDALRARLDDPSKDVRAEAEKGLFRDEV